MGGLFITLEGIDGCGKTTQLELLKGALNRRGIDLVATREPGGTPAGERIRALLSQSSGNLCAKTELLLIVAARAQHVEQVVAPAKEAGRVVISDRYADSSLAFQGYGRGLDLAAIREMNRFATGGLDPDLTIVFDLEPALARARLDARTSGEPYGEVGSPLSYLDDEEMAFHERVRNGYLELARRSPDRMRVIDASVSIEAAHERVLSLVTPLLGPA